MSEIDDELAKLDGMSKAAMYELYAELAGFREIPVDIETFIQDPYYMGNILGDGKLWPCWIKELKEVFPNPFISEFDELCATGSIGIGKTTGFGIVPVLYSLHKLLCMTDPHGMYGLLQTTSIVFAIFSPTLATSGDVLMSQIDEMLAVSPYFLEQQARAKKEKSKELLPNNIGFVVGSKPTHGLGRAIFGAVIDEANFSSNASMVAKQQYNTIKQRMTSRFKKAGVKAIPGQMCILSSRNTDVDFLETHIEKSRNIETTKVVELRIWEAKPWEYDIENTFSVFTGNDITDPYIIQSQEAYEAILDKEDIMQVPRDIRSAFESDIYTALKDLAGVSCSIGKNLVKRPTQVEAVAILPLLQNKDIIDLPQSEDSVYIQDFMNIAALKQRIKSKPGTRFIHLDMSLTGDLTGIACCAVVGSKKIERTDWVTGKISHIRDNIIEFDFCLAIRAIPGQEIPYFKVREFIKWLRDTVGMGVGLVTTDGYQSVDMRQLLTRQGFKTGYTSADRTNDCFLSLKNMIVEERVLLPNHWLLKKEIKELKKIDKKYDHPTDGSKDMADAVACAAYNCYQDDLQPAVNQDDFLAFVKKQNAAKNLKARLFGR